MKCTLCVRTFLFQALFLFHPFKGLFVPPARKWNQVYDWSKGEWSAQQYALSHIIIQRCASRKTALCREEESNGDTRRRIQTKGDTRTHTNIWWAEDRQLKRTIKKWWNEVPLLFLYRNLSQTPMNIHSRFVYFADCICVGVCVFVCLPVCIIICI